MTAARDAPKTNPTIPGCDGRPWSLPKTSSRFVASALTLVSRFGLTEVKSLRQTAGGSRSSRPLECGGSSSDGRPRCASICCFCPSRAGGNAGLPDPVVRGSGGFRGGFRPGRVSAPVIVPAARAGPEWRIIRARSSARVTRNSVRRWRRALRHRRLPARPCGHPSPALSAVTNHRTFAVRLRRRLMASMAN